jgi:hypothetical protein
MANYTLQQIADNLGVTGYDNTSLLIGIAEHYEVNPNRSLCLLYDILLAQGGDADNSLNYLEDIIVTLGGRRNSKDVLQEWQNITS